MGTIEPRKNHAYLLDAFDRLWKRGVDISLCLVGKVGWKCESLIGRIETHPELNRRLFMLTGLSDSDLAFCYGASKALVYPSFVEGFGLPLIEALGRGLPVLASDIPIFREIVGEVALYFDLSDPDSLCQAIEHFESTDKAAQKALPAAWTWPTWLDCTTQLLNRVKRNVGHVESADPTGGSRSHLVVLRSVLLLSGQEALRSLRGEPERSLEHVSRKVGAYPVGRRVGEMPFPGCVGLDVP